MTTPYNRLHPLIKINLVLLLFFLVIGGLYFARAFLIPLAYAVIFAMLLAPLCQKLESKGINKLIASIMCIGLVLVIFLGLGAMLSTQIAGFIEDIPEIEKQFNYQISQLQQFIQDTFGLSMQQQERAVQGNSSEQIENIPGTVLGLVGSFTITLATALLVVVYLFMLIYYRSRFSKFILKVVAESHRRKAHQIMTDSNRVAQQYIVGRGILILCLTFMYTIGLLIVGIENAILLSILAALLSIIPYIGNIIGAAFPLLMGLAQGGDFGLLLGVLLVFLIVQAIENYILEPYIVGTEVNIHPFFTILVIIMGEAIWGISGMILAIPFLGILKIIMDNIEPLEPYAYLIGNNHSKKSSKKKLKGIY